VCFKDGGWLVPIEAVQMLAEFNTVPITGAADLCSGCKQEEADLFCKVCSVFAQLAAGTATIATRVQSCSAAVCASCAGGKEHKAHESVRLSLQIEALKRSNVADPVCLLPLPR
jgi:hypothetical protein